MSESASPVLSKRPGLGEPAPDFTVRSNVNERFVFNTVGGRYGALLFLSAGQRRASEQALAAAKACAVFDDTKAALFVVAPGRTEAAMAGDLRTFFDDEGVIARAWGLKPGETGWRLLDPTLRVIASAPLSETDGMLRLLETAPPPALHAGVEPWAPVLLVPRVFEPELCRALIDYYRKRGGEVSGFMREIDGKTVQVHDTGHKRRADADIDDQALIAATRVRIADRLGPEIKKVFQFSATRMERYIVARYGAEDRGFFRAHRDNTTPGTAHRRFAVTLNLNAEEYDGGELRFPEYGARTYKPPTGGAVVFSCSLLHEATPVTRGERFAFLPFLYDDAAAQIRERNAASVVGGSAYRA